MRSQAQSQPNANRRSSSQPPGRRAHARGDHDDLYSVLEVSHEATAEEIRRAYKKMALKWHPDKNTDNLDHAAEMFKKVSHSYEILSKPETRQLYDAGGMAAVNGEVPVTPQTSQGPSEFRDADFNFERRFRPHGFGGDGFDGRPRHHHPHHQQHWPHPFMFHDPFEIFRQFFQAEEEGYMGHIGEDDGFARGRRGFGHAFGHPRGSFFDDDFGFGMMGMGMGFGGLGFGGFGGGGPRRFGGGGFFGGEGLHDAFFGGVPMGLGDGPSGSTVMMSSQFGGGLGGLSKSVSSSTVIQNGQRVTRTVTRTVDRDGNVHEDVDESVQQLPSSAAPARGVPRLSGAAGSNRSIGRMPPR